MRNQLIDDINRYIEKLNCDGLFVTVHGKGIGGLLNHNIHTNPFCTYVKTDDSAWLQCINCQRKVLKRFEKGQIFGMCYAGVEEYVFFVNDKTFVSVSGYGINREKAEKRIERLANDYILDKNELLSVYSNLNHTPENESELSVKIKPLCYMLQLLQLLKGDSNIYIGKNALSDAILSYIRRNFMNDITIRDIADACACSESSVSHIFKSDYGKTVNKFITELRINQAKELLKTTDMTVSHISLMCGFSNINYFPTIFKKHTGKTPREYRNAKK